MLKKEIQYDFPSDGPYDIILGTDLIKLHGRPTPHSLVPQLKTYKLPLSHAHYILGTISGSEPNHNHTCTMTTITEIASASSAISHRTEGMALPPNKKKTKNNAT